ncbi:MAG: hypothetical protein WC975_04165 [Phycisphaerae bacterium]
MIKLFYPLSPCHCEERSDEAIWVCVANLQSQARLLRRCAPRNDRV